MLRGIANGGKTIFLERGGNQLKSLTDKILFMYLSVT